MSKNIIILQHIAIETPGYILDLMKNMAVLFHVGTNSQNRMIIHLLLSIIIIQKMIKP